MSEIMTEYRVKLEKQLPIVCGNAIRAYLDTNMFMFPDAFKQLRSNTHLFFYSYYAIRNRTILAVKKLIEPAGKNKINLDSIVKIITKPDCSYLPEKEKEGLREWFDAVQKSENAIRLKNFRDAIAHDLPDSDDAMIIYNDLMYTMSDILEILSRLYLDVFNSDKMLLARRDAKIIALTLSKDYWTAIKMASEQAPKREPELKRLVQLLKGDF